MTSRKLVDGEFLSKLLGGSYEVVMGQVDEAVSSQPELFGGEDGDDVRTIGTFSNHAIVLNDNGEFFRTSFSVSEETGALELGEVERIDVPVRETSELSAEVRTESMRAVRALLDEDDDEADNRLGSLFELVQSGVKLTAEGVEDDLLEMGEDDPDWLVAVRENEQGMTRFVGAEANQELPKPRFETFIAEGDNGDDRHRRVIGASLRALRESLLRMQDSIAVARRSDGEYRIPKEDEDNTMVVEDFVEFTREFGADLDATVGLVEDAISVSEDGTLKSLARVHDGVAARVKEMGLAAAFSEKFARRFDQPQAGR
jgi:hypothetical protein